MVTMTRFNSQMHFCVIILSLMFITISFSKWLMENNCNICFISLARNQTIINIVSDKYLSFGLDSSLLRNISKLPINNIKFVKLTSYLSPAYIRIGGTAADCLSFNKFRSRIKLSQNMNAGVLHGYNISNFTISDRDLSSLYEFSHNTELQMLFNLNVLLRNSDGSWNSNNAKTLINYAKFHKMTIDWQLGNEPNSFFHVFGVKVSAEQLANDYCTLRTLLNEIGYQESILVGPEVNHIGDQNQNGVIYGQKFLNCAKTCINYFTWHQYYLNGHIAKLQDFINITIFNHLANEINMIRKTIKSSACNISMWLSETSSAYGGGAPKLSDRFVAGFLWVDKLGCSAKMGIQVVVRQSLYGGHYAMIGNDLNPNPDWWIAVIFKRYVSQKVLNLPIHGHYETLRLYAHCALAQNLTNKSGIIIYGININKEKTKLYIQGLPQKAYIYSYILTSDNLTSRNIFMNGQILRLDNDGNLPEFNAEIIKRNRPIIIPSYSIIFLLVNEMEFTACLK